MTKEEVIDLISDAGFGILSTVEGKQPHVRPMMPHLSEDGKTLLIALLPTSRTIGQIKENPLVEICFVDRKMWYCRVSGKASMNDDIAKKETLWNGAPMLRQYFSGTEDENFHVMQVQIEKIEANTPYQKTPETIDINS